VSEIEEMKAREIQRRDRGDETEREIERRDRGDEREKERERRQREREARGDLLFLDETAGGRKVDAHGRRLSCGLPVGGRGVLSFGGEAQVLGPTDDTSGISRIIMEIRLVHQHPRDAAAPERRLLLVAIRAVALQVELVVLGLDELRLAAPPSPFRLLSLLLLLAVAVFVVLGSAHGSRRI
jgi:hypothetical protein